SLSQMFRRLGVRTVLAYPSQFKDSAELWRYRFDAIIAVPPSTGLSADVPTRHRVRSFGDALISLGMGDAKRVFARIRLWEQVFERTGADCIVADYAPNVTLAAKGRLPLLAIGNGYTLPPCYMERYPDFTDRPPLPEQPTLAAVNRALHLTGREQLHRLPQVFEADIRICNDIALTDPFSDLRCELYAGPAIPREKSVQALRAGESINPNHPVFVYVSDKSMPLQTMLQGAVATKREVDVFASRADLAMDEICSGTAVSLHREPVDLTDMKNRFSLIVHVGGFNLALEALSAGVPQLAFAVDIEKRIRFERLRDSGLAHMVRAKSVSDSGDVTRAMRSAIEDDDMREACRRQALDLPADLHYAGRPMVETEVERLVSMCAT
ncbi:MAG: hypothetical protein AAF764_11630, partial [Pseudomonadota bacterium]